MGSDLRVAEALPLKEIGAGSSPVDPTTKLCRSCGRARPLDQFAKHHTKHDGRQSECRSCKSNRDRRGYRENPRIKASILESTRRQRDARRSWINEYLATHPCVDCGEPDPVVLEFDHVRGVKRDDVVVLAVRRLVPLIDVASEIEKCEIRCANCHRRRHHRVRHAATFVRD